MWPCEYGKRVHIGVAITSRAAASGTGTVALPSMQVVLALRELQVSSGPSGCWQCPW